MRGERERERESGSFKRGARGALDGRAANSSDAAGSGVAGVAWAAADVAGEGLRRQRGRGIWSITNSGCRPASSSFGADDSRNATDLNR